MLTSAPRMSTVVSTERVDGAAVDDASFKARLVPDPVSVVSGVGSVETPASAAETMGASVATSVIGRGSVEQLLDSGASVETAASAPETRCPSVPTAAVVVNAPDVESVNDLVLDMKTQMMDLAARM